MQFYPAICDKKGPKVISMIEDYFQYECSDVAIVRVPFQILLQTNKDEDVYFPCILWLHLHVLQIIKSMSGSWSK